MPHAPHCRAVHLTVMEPSESLPSGPDPIARAAGIGCVTVIVLALAFVAFLIYRAGHADTTRDSAEHACTRAVLAELKSPSTADVTPLTVSGDEGGPWVVEGTVDAENSFGASVRGEFTCQWAGGVVVDVSVR